MSTSGKNTRFLTIEESETGKIKRDKREEIKMDRTNKYMQNVMATDEYRDYFAELIAFVARLFRSDAFCGVLSTVTFIFSFFFVIGVVGGIELNLISYVVAIPTLAMLLCLLALVHKLRS